MLWRRMYISKVIYIGGISVLAYKLCIRVVRCDSIRDLTLRYTWSRFESGGVCLTSGEVPRCSVGV